MYGISPEGLSSQVGISIEEAKKMIKDFYRSYPQILAWQKRLMEQAQSFGYVESVFGRIRRLPNAMLNVGEYLKEYKEALRQAVNFPVQSVASDLNVLFLYEVKRLLGIMNMVDLELIGSVHDSGVFLVKEEKLESFISVLKQALVNLYDKVKLLLPVPFKIEISYGKRWGNLKKGGELYVF